MKKIVLLAALLLGVVGTASAVELGVLAGSSLRNDSVTAGTYGLSLGQKYGRVGAAVDYLRAIGNNNRSDVNQFDLVGSYDVLHFGHLTVAGKAGVNYLQTSNVGNENGYGALVGVGAEYAFTKHILGTVDYRYLHEQSKINQFDGNQVLVGAKYKF